MNNLLRIHTLEEYLVYELHWEPTRTTGGAMIGCCPFHQETHPSFSVVVRSANPQEHYFRCHSMSCGASGKGLYGIVKVHRFDGVDNERGILDVLNELEGKEGASFVPRKAQRPGISDLPPLPTEEQKHLMTAAFAWWRTHLFGGDTTLAKATRMYIQARGIDLDFACHVRTVGYAPYMATTYPSYTRFCAALEDACGPSWRQVAQSLGILNERGQVKFQGRLIFAQFNQQGQVISFQGRTLQQDLSKTCKFLMVSGIRKVPFSIPVEHPVLPGTVVVESYFGCLALAQAGLRNLAELGAGGTIRFEQYPAPIYLAQDHDLLQWNEQQKRAVRPGDEHARKHIDYCEKWDIPYKRVCVPLRNKDVDNFMKQYGPQAFVDLLVSYQDELDQSPLAIAAAI